MSARTPLPAMKTMGASGNHQRLHRGDGAEERGDRERQEHDSGKNDEGEDAIEGAESEHGESHACLEQHGIGRGSEAWMKAGEDGEGPSAAGGFVAGQCVGDAGHGHAEHHEPAKHAEKTQAESTRPPADPKSAWPNWATNAVLDWICSMGTTATNAKLTSR